MWQNVLRAGVLSLLCFGSNWTRGSEIFLPSQPTVSPNGETIVFHCEGDLWSVSSAGGVAQRLSVHPSREWQPVFSPDGQQLAFVSDRTGAEQVYVMPAAGGAPRQVTFHTAGSAVQDWHPDGLSLLVTGQRDHFWREAERFFLINLEQRQAEQLVFDAWGIDGKLSPDGRKVLFVRGGERWWRKGYRGARSAQIWLYDRDGGTYTKVLEKETDCNWPLWKPDGSGFYYTSGANSDGYNLWEYHLDTGEETQLTRFTADSVVFPALSRDGSTLVFRHLFHLYVYRPGQDPLPQRLTITYGGDHVLPEVWRRQFTRADNVSFTTDGLEVAFAAGGDIWVMDTELREPRQVTSSPEEEREPVFSADGKSLYFLSDREGQTDIWKAEAATPGAALWESRDFTTTRLTNSAEVEFDVSISPDEEHLFYQKKRGELWVMRTDGTGNRRILSHWNSLNYSISPDGKWIAASYEDEDFNDDVYILPVDGSREPYNVSRHPTDDYSPVWSPDGKILAYTGNRGFNGDRDIFFVYLRKQDGDQQSRDRKLEQARDKILKARPQSKPAEQKPAEAKPAETPQKPPLTEVVIDFEDLHRRVRRVGLGNTSASTLVFSPDSKKLAFAAKINDRAGTYTIEFPDKMTPVLLSGSTGSLVRWLPKTKAIVWLSGGVPGTLSATGAETKYTFRVDQEVDRGLRYRAAFDQCWRVMRDNWYDDRLGNRNWDEVRRKYREVAGNVTDYPRLATIIHLMLGELNGSHLGFSGSDLPGPANPQQWIEQTAHLGVRFDPNHRGPGLRIRDVIPDGPAAKAGSELRAGELILAINGTVIDPAYDLTQILNGTLARDLTLTVRSVDEPPTEREVTLRPISFAAARELLYPMLMQQRHDQVSEKSGNKFGYLHIRSMNQPSFEVFQKQLYELGYGKEGLIIDVRDNGGGFTTDHLLTALTQPRHSITVARDGVPGYPQDRTIYATWHKPIVVLCNQNSYSNAEIFSHAIKGLKRGKLVGVATAGGVISTGAVSIMDIGVLRYPFRGWYSQWTGEDMELSGAVPDVIIWPEPGQLPAGRDVQLEKAIEILAQEVELEQQKPPVKLRKATER
ncbi:MAG: PD40 domain-containing protein [Planctomycetaceae bacterium]|nr:PD40 domain-containing protein [Planctomycetaceae bacterium]